MKLIEADGQDVEAVYLAALAAREHALSGKGPVLLHLRTYRLTGPLRRRSAGLPRQGRAQGGARDEGPDPAPRRRGSSIGDDEFAALDAEVTAEVEASVEFAKAGTDPKPEDALKYVYA